MTADKKKIRFENKEGCKRCMYEIPGCRSQCEIHKKKTAYMLHLGKCDNYEDKNNY